MPRVAAVAAAVIGFLLVGVLVVLPFVREQRRLPAIVVQPSPLYSTALIAIRPDEAACLRGATIDRYSEVAMFQVGTRQQPAVPLELTVRGKGYSQRVLREPNYVDNEILAVQIQPPQEPKSVSICVRNRGSRPIDLYGSADTSQAPVRADIAGGRIQNFKFAFYEAEDATLFQRRQAIAERTSRFRPVGPDVVLLLALLAILGVPAALIAALGLSVERRRPT